MGNKKKQSEVDYHFQFIFTCRVHNVTQIILIVKQSVAAT